jgi:uncharacterized Ntn-hydrolase superfamily protein
VSAPQGTYCSTLWGAEVLDLMRGGSSAAEDVTEVTFKDPKRDRRQLSALDPAGRTSRFTGARSVAVAASQEARHVIAAGNMFASEAALDTALESWLSSTGSLDLRLLGALDAAVAAGCDNRGLMSAALLVVGRKIAPMSLRIDYSESPLAALRILHSHATSGEYKAWTTDLPTESDPLAAGN